jgi:hypothetical protein
MFLRIDGDPVANTDERDSPPPMQASGVMCPTIKPWLPPENRPTVMIATMAANETAESGNARCKFPAMPNLGAIRSSMAVIQGLFAEGTGL